MTAIAEIATTDDREAESRRKLTLLKAVGLDKVSPEQRELAVAIAKRYDLDLLLRHVVLVDGKSYITRDALLWIAHRSGQFDGIGVTRPVVEDDYWYAEATVYRKDMSHPFVYGGRYPVKGGNQKFAPEMAVKVAESMALRRAFNVSAPSADERWDVDVPTAEPEAPKSLAEKVAAKAQSVTPTDTSAMVAQDAAPLAEEVFAGEIVEDPDPDVREAAENGALLAAMIMTQCESKSPFGPDDAPVQCRRQMAHPGPHKTESESWPA